VDSRLSYNSLPFKGRVGLPPKKSLPFKGRVGVGMGFSIGAKTIPIPLLTSPLKGEELYSGRLTLLLSNST
jgi:hypothetical protein